jgi:hypothetical protein
MDAKPSRAITPFFSSEPPIDIERCRFESFGALIAIKRGEEAEWNPDERNEMR